DAGGDRRPLQRRRLWPAPAVQARARPHHGARGRGRSGRGRPAGLRDGGPEGSPRRPLARRGRSPERSRAGRPAGQRSARHDGRGRGRVARRRSVAEAHGAVGLGPASGCRACAERAAAGRLPERPFRDSGRGQSGCRLAVRRLPRRDGGGLLRGRRRQDAGPGAGHAGAGGADRLRRLGQASGQCEAATGPRGRRGRPAPVGHERRRG
uniref:Transcriptional regulator, AcrR family n=1 Tax=Parastrongyloides trichosuri TaxID=131310 RepID=A0A0N4ZGT1_PARTI